MSRYAILFILNAPFIFAALLNTITQYKLGKSSRRRMILQTSIWLFILFGLAIAGPVYEWLHANGLTDTNSMSLFDVVQITAIVLLLFIVNRSRQKLESLERRTQDLHQELSIRLSTKDR